MRMANSRPLFNICQSMQNGNATLLTATFASLSNLSWVHDAQILARRDLRKLQVRPRSPNRLDLPCAESIHCSACSLYLRKSVEMSCLGLTAVSHLKFGIRSVQDEHSPVQQCLWLGALVNCGRSLVCCRIIEGQVGQ